MNPINSIQIPTISPNQGIGQGTAQGIGQAESAQDSTPFKDFLIESMREVNTMQQDADAAVERLVTGDDVTPAEVLTAVQKADIAFRLMIEVRNKMVAAYEEIKNIRV